MLDRMKGPILKNRDEIAVMDRVNRVVLEILEILRAMVKPGVTTAQLNAVAEEELAKRGAKSPFKGYAPMGLPPYPAVLCASANDVIVHGIPSRTKLQEGDIIVGFDDHTIAGIDDLHKLLSEDRIGHKSSLVVIRGTEKLSLEVIPQESQNGASN